MESDLQTIQGLWKVESIRRNGNSLGYSVTHWEFDGDRVQTIDPNYVDGSHWNAFTLNPTTTPKRMDRIQEYQNRDGETVQRTFKQCYELNGDILRVGDAPIFGEYPEAISESISVVTSLSRYTGPRPTTKQPSGKVPLDSPVLGHLEWDDNLDQWTGSIQLLPDQSVGISISPNDQDDAPVIALAEEFVEWVRTHEQEARDYAAHEMIELGKDWRDEDENPEPITVESFARRITVNQLSFASDGTATLWYDDGDIFAGHVIAVSVNSAREFTDAQMMG